MAKEEIKYRMKHLARKFCKRNNVYTEFDGSVGKLIEKSYLLAYLLCLHESKSKIADLEKENAELKEEVKNNKDFATVAYMQGAESQKKNAEIQLTKAEDIISSLYYIIQGRIDYENNIQIKDSMDLAKDFLRR